jgi:hypothetical protein
MTDNAALDILTDIRNWIRAGPYASVEKTLETAFPDQKSRAAYQMFDGRATIEQVRVACKISPNALVALAQRCTAMGLMEMKGDKKRVRLFDLAEFGLLKGIKLSSQTVSE